MEKEVDAMKKRYKWIAQFALFIILTMLLTIPAFAEYKVYVNAGISHKINNITLSCKEKTYEKYLLYMTKAGKKTTISSSYDGRDIISNGKIAYFCEIRSGKKWLSELDFKKEKVKRLKALSDDENNIRLLDNYKSKIYYVNNYRDLYSYNLKNGKIKRELHDKHVNLWERKRHYFIIYGLDQKTAEPELGLYDTNNGKYYTISKNAKTWIIKSNSIYYVEGLTFDDNLDVHKTANVSVKKYNISTKKKKTLVKKITITWMGTLTSKSFSYYDINKKLKTKKW